MHTPQNNGKGSMCIVYYLVVYIYTYIVGVLPPNIRAASDLNAFKSGIEKVDLLDLVQRAHFKE